MTCRPVAIVIDRARGRSWQKADGGSILSDYGLHTLVVSDRPGNHYNRVCNDGDVTVILVESLDLDTLMRVVGVYNDRIIGVTTTSELFLHLAADLRETLGLPGKTRSYTERVRDKWAMKEIAVAHHIPAAAGVVASDASTSALHWGGDRYFIKPRRLSGSRGAREATGQSSLRRELDLLGSAVGNYLVEEFIDGPLLHIDGLVTGTGVEFVASAYTRPTHTAGGATPLSSVTIDDPIIQDRAGEFIRNVAEAWELIEEVFHCEAFWTGDRFVFCEIAGRPGGAGVPEVYGLIRGTDLRWAKTVLDLGLPLAGLPLRSTDTYRAGGWTVIYDTPVGDPSFSRFTGHIAADIRSTISARLTGHTGVGAATFVFGGDSGSDVLELVRNCEHQAASTRSGGRT